MKYWTEQEYQIIRDEHEKDTPWPEIARIVGRSKQAVIIKARDLGIYHGIGKGGRTRTRAVLSNVKTTIITQGLQFKDANHRKDCLFILGDTRTVCGEPQEKRAYCKKHYKLTHREIEEKIVTDKKKAEHKMKTSTWGDSFV